MGYKHLAVLLCLLLAISCAAHKTNQTASVSAPMPSENYYLPGTDSAVVKNAVQFSDRLLVDFNRRQQAEVCYQRGVTAFQAAESLWNAVGSISAHDSESVPGMTSGGKRHEPGNGKANFVGDAKVEKANQICLAMLDSAYKEIAQAKLLNPFDLDIRSLLIKVYLRQGEITQDTLYYSRAIDELHKFLLVDKSNPYIYEKLGECYFALHAWEKAYQFYHEAEKILKIVSKFKPGPVENAPTSFDSTRWIYYLQRQGEAKARIYEADKAISYLSQARELTKSAEIKQELQDILGWINWDAGNIRAAEIRDEILKLETAGDYKKARQQYLELLPLLQTPEAKNEINWKVSSIEYNFLGRKKEALKRLFSVIQTIGRGGQTSPRHEVYLKDYAAMCYSVGMDYLNGNDFRLAYIYFKQASQIDWNHKGECFFQLAILSRDHPTETIYQCHKALQYCDQLSPDKISSLYELLAVSYKRKGEFDVADQYFHNWVNQKNVIKN